MCTRIATQRQQGNDGLGCKESKQLNPPDLTTGIHDCVPSKCGVESGIRFEGNETEVSLVYDGAKYRDEDMGEDMGEDMRLVKF